MSHVLRRQQKVSSRFTDVDDIFPTSGDYKVGDILVLEDTTGLAKGTPIASVCVQTEGGLKFEPTMYLGDSEFKWDEETW